MINWKELTPHLMNTFPPMQDWEFEELTKSIKKGFDERMPIVYYKGEGDVRAGIIDGGNRHRACIATGQIPILKEFHGTYAEAKEYILRTNTRRNLTAGQKATIILDMDDVIEQLAEEAAVKHRDDKGQYTQGAPGGPAGKTADNVAKKAGVGKNTVKQSQKVKKYDAELYAKIKSGETSAKVAAKEVDDMLNKVKVHAPDLLNKIEADEITLRSAFNHIEKEIKEGEAELAIQRAAKSLLTSAVQEALDKVKDKLYQEALDRIERDGKGASLKLELTLIN